MKSLVVKKGIPLIPVIPFLVLAVMYLILPAAGIVVKGFRTPGTGVFTLNNFQVIFSKVIYQRTIQNSLNLSLLSSAVGLLISFLAALALTAVGKRTENAVMSILSMSANFAGLPLAFAFILVLGNMGVVRQLLEAANLPWLNDFNLYSTDGVMLIFIYFQIPLGTLLLVPSFQAIRKEWKEAAMLMHANSLQFWTRVGLPMLLPGLTGTFGMLFANALTAYATVYVLMSNNFPLMAIKITTLFTGDSVTQEELGSALSVIMILFMLAVIGLCNLTTKLFYRGGDAK
ncbi:MAG: ABC transporter permease subunit [Candidatus Limiplasma sp.]|nr:ABC transporter permease subunit [Candidatus Limiplasma sp.]